MIEPYPSVFCPVCGRGAIGGLTHPICHKADELDGLSCLFSYSGPLRKILQQLKYRFSTKIAEVFDKQLKKVNLDKHLANYTLVPIPLQQRRDNWRGFNQAKMLGELIAQTFQLNLEEGVLQRKVFEAPQVNLKLAQRKKNLEGAFAVLDKSRIVGKNILLFDDVWTTGATMREAAKTLKQAGADKVWGLCLASSHQVR